MSFISEVSNTAQKAYDKLFKIWSKICFQHDRYFKAKLQKNSLVDTVLFLTISVSVFVSYSACVLTFCLAPCMHLPS